MYNKKAGRRLLITLFIISLLILGAGVFGLYHFMDELNELRSSSIESLTAFDERTAEPFINSVADAPPFESDIEDGVVPLYTFQAPEGFTIISHSSAWDEQMLSALYDELMKNQMGNEIRILYEIIVYPDAREGNILASYTQRTDSDSFIINFPALPDNLGADFGRTLGTINLYNADQIRTIEGMAWSLSHEYGHLFTFYHMFAEAMAAGQSLENTEFARLRGAAENNLVVSTERGADYMEERFRYLIEIAAEDYVQLMGSPTTRQIVDFKDTSQRLAGASAPEMTTTAKNAFPQENLMLPLASEVPGLKEYFFSYINREAPDTIENRKEIIIEIEQNSRTFELVDGERTFIYYEVTWNAPYEKAIYTLITFNPEDYRGWGTPIRTVHQGENSSAIIGEYVVLRDDIVQSLNDNLANGTRAFIVIALLPDGTFFSSEILTHTFTGLVESDADEDDNEETIEADENEENGSGEQSEDDYENEEETQG